MLYVINSFFWINSTDDDGSATAGDNDEGAVIKWVSRFCYIFLSSQVEPGSQPLILLFVSRCQSSPLWYFLSPRFILKQSGNETCSTVIWLLLLSQRCHLGLHTSTSTPLERNLQFQGWHFISSVVIIRDSVCSPSGVDLSFVACTRGVTTSSKSFCDVFTPKTLFCQFSHAASENS